MNAASYGAQHRFGGKGSVPDVIFVVVVSAVVDLVDVAVVVVGVEVIDFIGEVAFGGYDAAFGQV